MTLAGTIGALLSAKGQNILSVAPDAMVLEAIRLMSENNIGALLVMTGSRLEGVISERDYTRKVILAGKSSQTTAVREIMTAELVTIDPSASVEDGMRLVTEKRVRHLPVVADGEVVGVVSIGDLVRWTISAQSAAIDQLQGFIEGRYPA